MAYITATHSLVIGDMQRVVSQHVQVKHAPREERHQKGLTKQHTEFGQQHLHGSLPCSDDAGGWEASKLSSKERRQLGFTAEGTSQGGGGASSLPCVCDALRAPSRAFPAESPQQDVTSQHSALLCIPDTLHNSAHVLQLPQASAHFPL